MKSVWSFWTKPYLNERKSSWYRDSDHWLAWGLSVDTASRHYPETCLITDDEGARILVDRLRLPFRHVSTALNGIASEDPAWWALGKIEAYRLQREPFVHIDTDVFLWKPIARRVASAGVFAQCPEPIVRGRSWYRPEEFEQAVGYPETGWIPEEWIWYDAVRRPAAPCCGIFGGTNLDFIRYYSDLAVQMVTDPRNRPALMHYRGKAGQMFLIEQYLLGACVRYHRRRPARFPGLTIRYIFDTMERGFDRDEATAAGYTHLAADAKRNPRIARDLQRAVRQDLPEYYARVYATLGTQGGKAASL